MKPRTRFTPSNPNLAVASARRYTVLAAVFAAGHLLTKFAARDRAQLVVAAYETGLVVRGQA